VDGIERINERVRLTVRGQSTQDYDFLAVATGVNTSALRLFEKLDGEYRPPRMAQTFIREYYLGEDTVEHHFGQSIHFFLLDLPGLHFAAIVPKQNSVTICLLGQGLNQEHFDSFVNAPQVRACMPDGWQTEEFSCHCSPRINLSGAIHPFADRMVFLGDIGVSRLYKDGIGAAYRSAKAAATAAVFGGIGEADLATSYAPVAQAMERDNIVGRGIFNLVELLKPRRSFGQALLAAVQAEQAQSTGERPISGIVWDLFTGSAPYQDVLVRLLQPAVWIRFLTYLGRAWIRRR
jgi:flavin-dependent dehydrogenase